MKRKLRIDILIVLILPYLLGLVLCITLFPSNKENYSIFFQGCLIVLLGLFVESITNFESYKIKSKDNGILSGLLISIFLLLITLNSYYNLFFMLNKNIQTFTYIIGLILFVCGGYLRVKAKKDLQGYFSHSLKIDQNHQLITTGLYRYVRHPAYLGTTLVLISTSLIFNSWIGFFLVVLLSPLGIKRIQNEEKMLIDKFGDDYISYSKQVKRIIPYLF
ncbi:protein-S-isoprenylcysteine O-methyltransferase Ste14 [Thermolongibacillus altinsuensis]|uniref:Protein-S-isoprenylcysteine O-methyltransferase Ste14 n=1 Tax=Thermolongibacillus altinsuensis TaxID=575256 RepID=A0A4V2Q9H1_9BACL|nr:isoprenylcysteine carboxylmethyltransferase family protein [Thermolongibacillus altinsuensis]TCL43369.1 protein-S-isoprenylcysteine O-methyltransferase Ste14 [Thermolongibacillus altinsuensis]